MQVPLLVGLLSLVAPHSSKCGILVGYALFWHSTSLAFWDRRTSLGADHFGAAGFVNHRVFHDGFSSNAAFSGCRIQLCQQEPLRPLLPKLWTAFCFRGSSLAQ